MPRLFDAEKYPNLARMDRIVKDFLASSRAKKMSIQDREEEICRLHPVYFLETYGHIQEGLIDSESGAQAEVRIIPFKLNPVQLLIADILCEDLIGTWKRVKAVILKCRKAGISTLMAGFDYYFMRFIPNSGAFIIADKSAHTTNIYNMVERFFMYDKLAGKPTRIAMPKNKAGLRLSNGSMLELDSGETKHPGTSQDVQICHMSENAKWAQAVDAEVSLLNSIPRTGFAWIIRESTAFGLNKYFQDCIAALEKKSGWKFIFIPWMDLDDCAIALDEGEKLQLTVEEVELQEAYSLDLEQIKFRRQKIHDLGSVDKFKQDFPMHEREPFYSARTTYFNIELLDDRREEIDFYRIWREMGFDTAMDQFPKLRRYISTYEGGATAYLKSLSSANVLPKKVQISMNEGKVTYQRNEDLKESEGFAWMWRDPDRRRKYLVSVDPAEGISTDGYTSDLSVAEVFDCYKREQVAEFAGIYDEEILARYAVLLATLYNQAMIVVEMNNSCGAMTWSNIKERMKYHRLYYTQKVSRHQTISTHPGWKTNRANKQEVCGRLKIDFKNDDCILHSIPLLIEMLNFVDDGGKLHAGSGHTDDRVMATAIGLTVIDQSPNLRSQKFSESLEAAEAGFARRGEFDGGLPFGVRNLDSSIDMPAEVGGVKFRNNRKVVQVGRRSSRW